MRLSPLALCAALLMALGLAGCGGDLPISGAVTSTPTTTTGAAPAGPPVPERAYTLGPGDKLRIVVFNEQELSREYEVDSSGSVSMLLVGPVRAGGLTPREFEQELMTQLRKFLRNPRVSVDILTYRPFYILGEVNKAGEYPYRSGMNVLSAVAAAGGYSYRANTRTVYIQRGNEPERAYEVTTRIPIFPGDVIRIPERFF